MAWSLFRRYGNDGYFQSPADDFSNLAHRHALFGHSVIPRACFQILKRQSVKTGRIENMHGRPAVASIADISGYALLPSKFDCISDQPSP